MNHEFIRVLQKLRPGKLIPETLGLTVAFTVRIPNKFSSTKILLK